MGGEANATYCDLDTMSRRESYAPEASVTHSLDRDTSDDTEDGEDHKGEEVSDDDDA